MGGLSAHARKTATPMGLRSSMGMLLWWTLAKTSRREETEKLGDYIAELKEALQDAEERLNDLEKQCVRAQRG